jgi:hypothetical protein
MLKRKADNSTDNPDALCLPMGIMLMTSHPYPKKIIHAPQETLVIYDGSGTTVRELFMDGSQAAQGRRTREARDGCARSPPATSHVDFHGWGGAGRIVTGHGRRGRTVASIRPFADARAAAPRQRYLYHGVLEPRPPPDTPHVVRNASAMRLPEMNG